MNEIQQYKKQFKDIIANNSPQLSNIKPSIWAERNIIMPPPIAGRLRYDNSPYTREIIDCFDPNHPMRRIAIMKGAQLGFSSTILVPVILYIISQDPCNCFLTVGAPELIPKAMEKIDLAIKGAGLSHLLTPQVMRKRNLRTGDTGEQKEFLGGYIKVATANNHKALRQLDLKIGLFDDFESSKNASKESGDTRKMLEARFNAYAQTCKIAYISTPERMENSNIYPVYLLGDQRKFTIPCEVCHEHIELIWEDFKDGCKTGIHYELDNQGRVIKNSVGYICQECGGYFKDNNKLKLMNDGIWKPTSDPREEGFYSYQLSCLYATAGMADWYRYAVNYIEANPTNQPRNETMHQTFVNLCLGLPYEPSNESPDSTNIQKNIRNYEIGIVPENMSMSHGNGKIILITCAADINGTKDDARLDYEIVAWAENGVSYSIEHGSIGTYSKDFNEKKKDRQIYTYEMYKENSVWIEFEKIIGRSYKSDLGRNFQIMITGIDVGYLDKYIYNWMDIYKGGLVVSLRGERESQYMNVEKDVRYFKVGKARPDYYLLAVGFIKDDVAGYMGLKWDMQHDKSQPSCFMNFPIPSGGKYLYDNFFSHYESEHRTLVTTKEGINEFRWVKQSSGVQNHMWDCRIYNFALKDIFVWIIAKASKYSNFTWSQYAAMAKNIK